MNTVAPVSKLASDIELAAATASLPAMTPQRLHKLAEATRPRRRPDPESQSIEPADWAGIWDGVLAGRSAAVRLARTALGQAGSGVASPAAVRLARQWNEAAGRSRERSHPPGVSILVRGLEGYPKALEEDREAPEVLFCQGEVFDPGRLAVAVIGTRTATYYGIEVARELGADLTLAGISVVSGLASGIDAAAHEGALTCFDAEGGSRGGVGRPVGVVGGGVDVVYPRATARMRSRVAEVGMLVSEAPLGAAPERWRFPLRNRIIAALTPVVVVVESRLAGGAMHTVEAASVRDNIEVMAVPGSIRSPASSGTNGLITCGAQMVTSASDVVCALERAGVAVPCFRASAATTARTAGASVPSAGVQLTTDEQSTLKAVDHSPTPTSAILARTGRPLEVVTLALDHLSEVGLVRDYGGAWGLMSAARS